MAAPFYNQGDQDIYAGGEHFIPQQQYRLNYTPSQSLASTIGNTGITNTQATNPYIYPQGGGGGGGNTPLGQTISDFETTVEGRQKRLQDPNKISQLLGNFIPQQRSARDMLASGVRDTSMLRGIPLGIGSMISRALPDKYYDMPRGDQAFIQSQMGYSDPNTNQGNQDPFGVNVRSAFGDYGAYTDKMSDPEGQLAALVAKQEEEGKTNTIQMRKLNFYKNLRMKRKNIQSDAALIDKGKDTTQPPIPPVPSVIHHTGGGNGGGIGSPESKEGGAPGTAKGEGSWKGAQGGRIGFADGNGGTHPLAPELEALTLKSFRQQLSPKEVERMDYLIDATGSLDEYKAQGGRIGYRWGERVDPEEPSENIFEIMQDQNIPFSEQVEAGPTEEQVAMVIDMDGKGIDMETISSITGLGKEIVLNILGVEMAQGGIARLL
jgi:hypothetical protein